MRAHVGEHHEEGLLGLVNLQANYANAMTWFGRVPASDPALDPLELG